MPSVTPLEVGVPKFAHLHSNSSNMVASAADCNSTGDGDSNGLRSSPMSLGCDEGSEHDLSGSPPTPMLDHRRVESTMDMSSYRIVPGSAARRPLQRLLEHTPPEDSPSPGDATVLDERAFQERETLLREKKHDQDTATHPVAHLTEHVAHSPKLPFGTPSPMSSPDLEIRALGGRQSEPHALPLNLESSFCCALRAAVPSSERGAATVDINTSPDLIGVRTPFIKANSAGVLGLRHTSPDSFSPSSLSLHRHQHQP